MAPKSEPAGYAPFDKGPFRVRTRSFEAADTERDRIFPCMVWHPADAGGGPAGNRLPLVVFSHASGAGRNSASYLCSHLASHGYVVAAMDHSELVAANLALAPGESADERPARIQGIIASRVPDVRLLLDILLGGEAGGRAAGTVSGSAGLDLDPERVGLVGHSFGGWTVLAVPEVDARARAVVALGPGGSSRPRPGILALTLTFEWGRDVPTLYLAAEDDVPIPLDAVTELMSRTRASRRMFVLRRADHQHFLDDVEAEHEALRAMSLPGEAAWIPGAMRPIAELCPGEHAHLFVRGLTLAHLDATLRRSEAAGEFLDGDVVAELAARGVAAFTPERC
jgi:dienelactone hydrolase